jgi:two-component system, NtrC family, C4-dicarboxylate transport sensor histidine kinase DctB
MLIESRPLAVRYGLSLTSVGLALAVASLLPWGADPSHFTLFFAAVMVSTWYGSLGPGIVATILSAVCLEYFFISQVYSKIPYWQALLRLGVFLVVAFVMTSLTTARKRAEEALHEAQAELEQRVKERTVELSRANELLRAEIVERKRAEYEFWRLQVEMGRVGRLAALGKMTGAIAHELGTPLNSVLGYTQLLAGEDLPESARRRLAVIETQIHRMVEIIQHYLSQSRGSAPKTRIHINDLIRETLVLLQPILQQHGLVVTTALADSPPAFFADAVSLQRVLINLIDNAVDASAGKGPININTTVGPGSDDKASGVIIEIVDKGVGIPSEILPKIFDLFVTTKSPGKGTGLGLAICQEIIKANGGTINVSSQVGQGTTVQIFLPADAG